LPVNFTKYLIATGIAILLHAVGLIGLLYFNQQFFENTTPINLLLMLLLLVWTQTEKNKWFFIFFLICFLTGLGVEIIGIQYGVLFGHYHYGDILGYKIRQVPVILGVNWFIVIYGSGSCIYLLGRKYMGKISMAIAVIFGGALLAVFYDWLMEPVAVRLDFWYWNGDRPVPFFNYICWFLIGAFLLSIYYACKFNKLNKFAVNLMLIQMLFFLMLRFFLN